MPAYVVVTIDVKDSVTYEKYKKTAPPSIAIYGGRYLVRGGALETLEGTWAPRRLVILEFESVERAKACSSTTRGICRLRLMDRSHYRSSGSEERSRFLRDAGLEVRAIDRCKINWLWGLMTATALRPAAAGFEL